MAYQPTDNTPRLFSFDHSGEENHQVNPPPPPPEDDLLEDDPDIDDGFIAMITETLRGLTTEQRHYAQREIIKVLNQARFIGADGAVPDASSSGHSDPSSSLITELTGSQRAPASESQYESDTTGFIPDRYEIAFSPQRTPADRPAPQSSGNDNDISDLDWGFTPDNSLTP